MTNTANIVKWHKRLSISFAYFFNKRKKIENDKPTFDQTPLIFNDNANRQQKMNPFEYNSHYHFIEYIYGRE